MFTKETELYNYEKTNSELKISFGGYINYLKQYGKYHFSVSFAKFGDRFNHGFVGTTETVEEAKSAITKQVEEWEREYK